MPKKEPERIKIQVLEKGQAKEEEVEILFAIGYLFVHKITRGKSKAYAVSSIASGRAVIKICKWLVTAKEISKEIHKLMQRSGKFQMIKEKEVKTKPSVEETSFIREINDALLRAQKKEDINFQDILNKCFPEIRKSEPKSATQEGFGF